MSARKAPWVASFPAQHQRLFPERTKVGGVKARSGAELRRMEIYHGIRELYLSHHVHQFCAICKVRRPADLPRVAKDVHHVRGRDGLLLFDVRYWRSACRRCHEWVQANPEKARLLGMLASKGEWNKEVK